MFIARTTKSAAPVTYISHVPPVISENIGAGPTTVKKMPRLKRTARVRAVNSQPI